MEVHALEIALTITWQPVAVPASRRSCCARLFLPPGYAHVRFDQVPLCLLALDMPTKGLCPSGSKKSRINAK